MRWVVAILGGQRGYFDNPPGPMVVLMSDGSVWRRAGSTGNWSPDGESGKQTIPGTQNDEMGVIVMQP